MALTFQLSNSVFMLCICKNVDELFEMVNKNTKLRKTKEKMKNNENKDASEVGNEGGGEENEEKKTKICPIFFSRI